MARISLKAIIPKKMNIAKYEKELRKVAEKETKAIEKEFRKVSDNFSGSDPRHSERPTYTKKVEIKGGRLIASAFTNEARMSWLNWGTDERWAIMSDDWQSKTRVLRLNTRAGGGRVVARGRRAMSAPRKGITARRFDIAVRLKRTIPFQLNTAKAMAKASFNLF